MTETKPTQSAKQFTLNVLNGISIGGIVALVPSALLGQLMLALKGVLPFANTIITLTNFSMTLLPVVSGLCVAMLFKMTPIQSSSLAIVAMMGAGNWKLLPTGGFGVQGTGDVINIMVTIAIGVLIIQVLGTRMKAYTILLLPAPTLVIAGGLGLLTLGPIHAITVAIGEGIMAVTKLQPVMMGTLLAMIFAALILTPISSVGIATAISLSGIASGSANLGITACGFALAIFGSQANSLGTSLAHFLGSPKIQMANMLEKPKLFIPVIINAGILGALGAIFNVKGTPMSAGFGFSGLIGPMAALNGGTNVIVITILFFVLPIALAIVSKLVFAKQMDFMYDSDFMLSYE